MPDGHIYRDGDGYLLCIMSGESPRRCTNIKQRLGSFCALRQDGDDEGTMHLDYLPTPAEAELVREATGIRKKRTIIDEVKATLASRLSGDAIIRPLTSEDAIFRRTGRPG